MKKYSIPTADYRSFGSYDDAKRYLDHTCGSRVVIKVDGLAAGKGVILPANQAEAQHTLHEIMVERKFGTAGQSVVIEEFLEGDEISILTFCDGETFVSLPPGQDHKRIFEGNKGLNTGGMGVYAPLPFVGPDQLRDIDRDIIRRTLDGLKAEGIHVSSLWVTLLTILLTWQLGRPFTGMLFTGIILTRMGPKVLEYNARFGDPETQTMMMLLAPECDLAAIILACAMGKLGTVSIPLLPGHACNVIVAAGGYPESYSKGDTIELGPFPEGLFSPHFA